MAKKLNILICPLEWGLGHAARSIPIAATLKKMNHNVMIAAGEEHLSLFQEELPGLTLIPFPGFKPGYSRYLPQYLILLLQIPILVYHILNEHSRLKGIIDRYSVDIVISDNRFGLWNNKVRTAYITHMPHIPFPAPFRFLEPIGVLFHRYIIRKYSVCFIPDLPGEVNLTGRLTHNDTLPENVRFIGILSRFTGNRKASSNDHEKLNHFTVILSGPEPQKTLFKEKVLCILENVGRPVYFLEGKPGMGNRTVRSGNFTFISHLPAQEMGSLIEASEKIITRAGYSTIMELVSLNKSALLVPTPGQTEQEYLASSLSSKRWFSFCKQADLTKQQIQYPVNEDFPAEINDLSPLLLQEALNELLK